VNYFNIGFATQNGRFSSWSERFSYFFFLNRKFSQGKRYINALDRLGAHHDPESAIQSKSKISYGLSRHTTAKYLSNIAIIASTTINNNTRAILSLVLLLIPTFHSSRNISHICFNCRFHQRLSTIKS